LQHGRPQSATQKTSGFVDLFLSAEGRKLKPSSNNDIKEVWDFWTEPLDVKRGPSFNGNDLIEKEYQKPCQIIYFSGTTGLRKCDLISHRNLVAAFTGISYRIQTDAVKHAHPKITNSLQKKPGEYCTLIYSARLWHCSPSCNNKGPATSKA
jgi:acyl-CoA synthetase (AMP-forming)/AMP-acid ligase II